jgi:hypothetical protein
MSIYQVWNGSSPVLPFFPSNIGGCVNGPRQWCKGGTNHSVALSYGKTLSSASLLYLILLAGGSIRGMILFSTALHVAKTAGSTWLLCRVGHSRPKHGYAVIIPPTVWQPGGSARLIATAFLSQDYQQADNSTWCGEVGQCVGLLPWSPTHGGTWWWCIMSMTTGVMPEMASHVMEWWANGALVEFGMLC